MKKLIFGALVIIFTINAVIANSATEGYTWKTYSINGLAWTCEQAKELQEQYLKRKDEALAAKKEKVDFSAARYQRLIDAMQAKIDSYQAYIDKGSYKSKWDTWNNTTIPALQSKIDKYNGKIDTLNNQSYPDSVSWWGKKEESWQQQVNDICALPTPTLNTSCDYWADTDGDLITDTVKSSNREYTLTRGYEDPNYTINDICHLSQWCIGNVVTTTQEKNVYISEERCDYYKDAGFVVPSRTTKCETIWIPSTDTYNKGTWFKQIDSCRGPSREVQGTYCAPETATWKPSTADYDIGVSFTQTNSCGETRIATGTKCYDTSWTPSTDEKNVGVEFTQTSNCGNVRQAIGTSPVCLTTSWTPSTDEVDTVHTLTQTSNCGETRIVQGTKPCLDDTWTPSTDNYYSWETVWQKSNCYNTRTTTGTKSCTDETWTPSADNYTELQQFTQTSSCGRTRTATGTQCAVQSWTPSTDSIAYGETFTQTSNCGTTREAVGTWIDTGGKR